MTGGENGWHYRSPSVGAVKPPLSTPAPAVFRRFRGHSSDTPRPRLAWCHEPMRHTRCMTPRRVHPGLRRRSKLAVSRSMAVVSDTQVKRLWADCASVRNRSTLYAFADESRANVPSESPALGIADLLEVQASRLAACAAEFRQLAADLSSAAAACAHIGHKTRPAQMMHSQRDALTPRNRNGSRRNRSRVPEEPARSRAHYTTRVSRQERRGSPRVASSES